MQRFFLGVATWKEILAANYWQWNTHMRCAVKFLFVVMETAGVNCLVEKKEVWWRGGEERRGQMLNLFGGIPFLYFKYQGGLFCRKKKEHQGQGHTLSLSNINTAWLFHRKINFSWSQRFAWTVLSRCANCFLWKTGGMSLVIIMITLDLWV